MLFESPDNRNESTHVLPGPNLLPTLPGTLPNLLDFFSPRSKRKNNVQRRKALPVIRRPRGLSTEERRVERLGFKFSKFFEFFSHRTRASRRAAA